MRTTALVLAMLTLTNTALAEAPEAPEAPCATLEGWHDKCDVGATLVVIMQATEQLEALGDCSQHSKKSDLAACAAQATSIGAKLSTAALSMHTAMATNTPATGGGAKAAEGKTGKAARSNANRMEAEETDE